MSDRMIRATEARALREADHDPVNHPAHYKADSGLEAIDVIEAFLGVEGAYYYCRGNALKYELRAGAKGNTAQDHRKAAWYAERAASLWEQMKETPWPPPRTSPTTTEKELFLDPEEVPDGYWLIRYHSEPDPVPAEKIQGQWWVVGNVNMLPAREVNIVSRLTSSVITDLTKDRVLKKGNMP